VKRRILAVVVAIVLAALGTGLVLVYVSRANSRAIAGQKAVTVLVAAKLIPAGTAASAAQSEGLLQREVLPAKSVPANAVRSISPGLSELVASAAIEPGQLLLRPMLVTADLASATGGIAVPPGTVAVTLNLCLPEAVAGYLHPGSTVAVYDTSVPPGGSLSAGANCTAAHSQQGPAQTQLVLGSAEVLSVGPASTTTASTGSTTTTSTAFSQGSASSSQSQTGTLVTLAVPRNAVSQLILVTVTGLPYLALLS
jgi:pilus assembly protein CpaB